MSDQNHDPISEYLDGDSPDAVDLTHVEKAELARQIVVDGVSKHLLGPSYASTADQVREGMAIVYAEDHRRVVRNRWFGGLVAAAALAITSVLYLWQPPTLDAVLARMQEFAMSDVDRKFDCALDKIPVGEIPRGTGVETSCSIYANGGHECFAWNLSFRNIPMFGDVEFWLGDDGEEQWIVFPPNPFVDRAKTVLFSRTSLKEARDRGDAQSTPFLRFMLNARNVPRVLGLIENLGRHYKVEKTPDSASAKGSLRDGEIDLTAYRSTQADRTLPASVRMIVDEETGTPRTIRLTYIGDEFDMVVKLKHVAKFEVDPDIYFRDSHHGKDATIIDLDDR